MAADGIPAAIKILKRAPKIDLETAFWIDSYQLLSTERSVGMGAGPIPISSYFRYAEFYELTRDETKFLIACVREIDSWYLEAASKSRAKAK